MARHLQWIYPLDDIPNYEPGLNDSVAAKAHAMGKAPEETMYDMLLEDEGRKSFMLSLGNLHDGSLDEMGRMLEHNQMVIGLGDGGAHYGMICDSSYPTFMLTHWTRKRPGKKFPLERIVRMMSAETARSVGLFDRGVVAPGYKADINIINYDKLLLPAPHVVHDLPGGGQRLDQKAEGYVATIVSGQVIARDGKPTAARPGRLVRGRQPAPRVA
jgi:N-acyl-D-aspartate/D-glutamate deacylase